MGLRRTLRKLKIRKENRRIVSEVMPLLSGKMSLDVSRRNGFFVFHNKGNSLVKRGETYEPEVQNALKVLVGLDRMRNDTTVVADIGANIGLHSFCLKSLYPEMQIIAFDPSPYSWKYMELSVKYNKIQNVRIEKIALSDKNGTIDLFNWGQESSYDSLENTGRVVGVKPNIINVPVARLDDIKDLPRVTVIKMDCEGAELSILKGAKQLLLNNKPLILLEFNKYNMQPFNVNSEQIFTFMSEIDYSIYNLDLIKLNQETFNALLNSKIENFIILPNGLIAKNK
jgi:FkbM family methyltransferase